MIVKNGEIPSGIAYNGDIIFGGSSGGGGTGGITPRNVKNVGIKLGVDSIGIKWSDPDDTLDHEGNTYCKWQGTKLLYRDDGELLLDQDDGEEILTSEVKDEHSTNYVMIENLVPDNPYCFGIFPYSVDGNYNVNESNCITIAPTVTDFGNSTDEQFTAILEAHYKGLIDVADYWNVGDTRVMHLNAMSSGTGGEAHVAQDMTMVIVAINHDDLAEQVGVRTKSAVTLQCREALGKNGSAESGQNYGGTGQWSGSTRRTWLNNTFAGALPTYVQPLLKTVVKKNLANHTNNTAGEDTNDKIFLPSYPEMFGSAGYSYYKGSQALEGNQYPYYNSNARRIKYYNKNGSAGTSACIYWLRSPSSHSSVFWIFVATGGTVSYGSSTDSYGVAPAFCL